MTIYEGILFLGYFVCWIGIYHFSKQTEKALAEFKAEHSNDIQDVYKYISGKSCETILIRDKPKKKKKKEAKQEIKMP